MKNIVFVSAAVVGAMALMGLSSSRPARLDIQKDCGAIPNDGLDDTKAIQACLARAPREIVVPPGVFLVDRTAKNQPAAIEISVSDTVLTGRGPSSVIRLVRDETGFNAARILGIRPTIFGTDVERVTVRNLTIDGGRGERSCLETKHTPGGARDGRGQQGHGIFIGAGCSGGPNDEGCTDYVRDVRIENVSFTGLSGDAIYLYNNVENMTVKRQTIRGYCRAGIAVNAYEDCDAHVDAAVWKEQEARRGTQRPFVAGQKPRGLRNLRIQNVTMVADATATDGARGLDVEPNAKVCDITLESSQLDEAEIGGVRRLKVLRNAIQRTGHQPGGQLQLVSIDDAVVEGNLIRTDEEGKPPLYARIINRGRFHANTILTSQNLDGIQVSNNGNKMSRDIILSNNVVAHTGGGSTKWAIYTAGVRGKLTVVDNVLKGFQSGVHFFGGDDVLSMGNVFDVVKTANHFRVGTGEGRIKKVRVEGNRGNALNAYDVNGTLDGFRDCGDAMSGARLSGGNPLLPCAKSAQRNP